MRKMKAWCLVLLLLVVAGEHRVRLTAQTIEQVTFEEAILRAMTNHPTVHEAAAGVLRADSILQQVRDRGRQWTPHSASTSSSRSRGFRGSPSIRAHRP